ncbi:MAG TPA: DUF2141 domain-containing protein [Sphingomonas sp.]|nr:DUF2141 domain-containing protein [Sphingomonas sp.]
MRTLFTLPLMLLALAAAPVPPAPELGTAEGRCRPDEAGPAILVTVEGLKDRTGVLRLELFSSDPKDFLAGDSDLIAAGKTFRRVVEAPAPFGPTHLCIRAPAAGTYALALIHDRDGKRSFSIWHDGVGFAGNPPVVHGKPPPEKARITIGNTVTQTVIIMNYMRGLFTFGPMGGN